MNTEARRRASATFAARMKTEGYRKVTVWLSPEALARLDVARGFAGSKDKAVEAALMAGGVSVPKAPKSPPVARKTAKENDHSPAATTTVAGMNRLLQISKIGSAPTKALKDLMAGKAQFGHPGPARPACGADRGPF